MSPTVSAIADYYRKGIETALISPEEARAWADDAIARFDVPDFRYIDISLSKSIPELITALRSFEDVEAQNDVGPWLLARLQGVDVQSTETLVAAVRQAMLVCRHCDLGDDLYYELDSLDNSLFLTRYEKINLVEGCRGDFLAFLSRYAKTIPASIEA